MNLEEMVKIANEVKDEMNDAIYSAIKGTIVTAWINRSPLRCRRTIHGTP